MRLGAMLGCVLGLLVEGYGSGIAWILPFTAGAIDWSPSLQMNISLSNPLASPLLRTREQKWQLVHVT